MKKLPRVVILGFPNVGKSTLFNRLLGKRKALIHNMPGMTRDSIEERARIIDRDVVLVDTGGLFGVEDEPLSERVRQKAWDEVARAGLVLFLVDSRRDLSPSEEDLLREVKKRGVPVILVVNKVDSDTQEAAAADFYRLGVERTLFISAEHKRNLDELEEALAASLPVPEPRAKTAVPAAEGNISAAVIEEPPAEAAEPGPAVPAVPPFDDKPLRIAIVGRTNVGKSSLINRLLGEEKLLVSDIPGTTRDSTDTLVIREGRPYCLIDTAGIRKMKGAEDSRERAGIIRSRNNIKRADVVCLVLDSREFPTRQDGRIAQFALESGKPLMIALNKWDLVDKKDLDPQDVRDIIFNRMNFVSYAPLLFISAKTGQRIVKILDTAEIINMNALRRIETSKLNVFLEEISGVHPPRLENGGRAKLRYITQKAVRPPTFILFTGSKGRLAPTYEKFLTDSMREEFGLFGSPIRLIIRSK